jgi:hypothetical protein
MRATAFARLMPQQFKEWDAVGPSTSERYAPGSVCLGGLLPGQRQALTQTDTPETRAVVAVLCTSSSCVHRLAQQAVVAVASCTQQTQQTQQSPQLTRHDCARSMLSAPSHNI